MTLSLHLYRFGMRIAALFAPVLFQWRKTKGKELAGRYHERVARDLPERGDGRLIWLHGASLGECRLLVALAEELRHQHPDVQFLFTSQTISAAQMLSDRLPERARHQMFPLDTPAAAARFITHWSPQLCIFAESEIWPNVLRAAKQHGSRTALINARMTQASISRWGKTKRSATNVFGQFDAIIAANRNTARGLSQLLERDIAQPGNLKAALIEHTNPSKTPDATAAWHTHSPGGQIILGASTHDGEEAVLLEAVAQMPDTTRLILAPRHIDRADVIEEQIRNCNMKYARRSLGQSIEPDTRILLADTFGEMNLWYAAADLVFLGGSLSDGIGGHNPLEPLRYGRPIAMGPHTYNFSDINDDLGARGWVQMVKTSADLAAFFREAKPLPRDDIDAYFAASKGALTETLSTLSALLNEEA